MYHSGQTKPSRDASDEDNAGANTEHGTDGGMDVVSEGTPSDVPGSSSGLDELEAGSPRAATEDIHVRNYDFERSYEVVVRVEDPSGDRLFSRRYFLQPGQSRSEHNVLAAGTYRITAAIDPPERDASDCAIGDTPDHTGLVEVGNGIVSVSEGLYR